MPTQASKTQKDQKVRVSDFVRTGIKREEEAVANIMVRRREGEMRRWVEIRRLKVREPSITEAMNAANIVPKGRDVVLVCECAAFKAGVQKKTNRYMLPSKKQDARPRVRMRLSVKTVLSALLAGVADGEGVSEWWLSP